MQVLVPAMQDRLDHLVNTNAVATDAAARDEAQQLLQVERLLQSPAYFNAAHPEHNTVKTQVRLFTENFFGSAPSTRRPSAIVLDSGTGAIERQR